MHERDASLERAVDALLAEASFGSMNGHGVWMTSDVEAVGGCDEGVSCRGRAQIGGVWVAIEPLQMAGEVEPVPSS